MSDEKEIKKEGTENLDEKSESPEDFKSVTEDQKIEVEGDMVEVKRVGADNIVAVENDGIDQEVGEMKEVIDETTEEAEEAKEKYEEDLKNIPNAGDLAESFKTEKETEEAVVEELPVAAKVKTETTKNIEKEKSCPKCGARFSSSANFCGRCGAKFEETEVKTVEPNVKKVSETQQPETTKAEKTEGRQISDRLSEFNVSIEAINMKDKEAAIERINETYLKLKVFVSENQEAISKQELGAVANAIRSALIEAKRIIEERGNDETVENKSTIEDMKADAEKAVNFVVQNANKSLDFLRTSEETPSGKISSLIYTINSLNKITERYKDVIDGDEKLRVKLNSAIKEVNSVLKEREKLQTENDKLAKKYNV